ncbi:MAG: carbamoyltransferase HypF [Anaerolineales bacterium]|nr:carbamoyltransferase HypF [Anaerolineales bacterium]
MADRLGAQVHITGIVQGVGFRPFVYGLAVRYGLAGWVRNTSAGVDIAVDGTRPDVETFLRALQDELPPLARIDTFEDTRSAPGGFVGFSILHSEAVAGAFQPVSPDVATCPDCLAELADPSDRRFRYPFINCTNCGPRFTIITDVPYDRPNTSMAPFALCPDCAREYQDPLDRRFHAQPVACPVCGPQVWLEESGLRSAVSRPPLRGDEAIRAAQRLLAEGHILAVKGLGGFHLACDAAQPAAVTELRRRKLRVDKPFALMMADLKAVEEHCWLNAAERELLCSRSRPIVLLQRRPDSSIAAQVAPRQDSLGVMLPYTPLHALLLGGSPPPVLVMTSGNLSEEPIATDNAEACQRLASLADAFLLHNRAIRTRCDDSVVRVAEPPGQPTGRFASGARTYFLRRSRGYAPDPIQLPFEVPPILACGPELKNTFCLTRQRYAFVSQHIGDMQNYETLLSFEDGVRHFEALFRIHPTAVAVDLHPDYLATRYGHKRAEAEGLSVVAVQHHHAHIAACMADNGLDGSQPVIGLSFDGTGYGSDGAIWGGEVLLADYRDFTRPFQLAYFPLPGGDAAIMRPSRTALALLWSLGLEWEDWLPPCADVCTEDRLRLRIQLERGLNAPRTSSLGRLFDAAAALAGVRQQVNYEAQAAIEFEAAADPHESGAYLFEIRDGLIDPRPVIAALLADVRAGESIPVVSARFHNGLAVMARQVCAALRLSCGVQAVALSGGVWQNMLLLRRSVDGLRSDGFTVHMHRQVPANDGGLALGQALVAAARLQEGGLE